MKFFFPPFIIVCAIFSVLIVFSFTYTAQADCGHGVGYACLNPVMSNGGTDVNFLGQSGLIADNGGARWRTAGHELRRWDPAWGG